MTYSRSKYLVITLDYVIPILLFVAFLIFLYFTFYSSLFSVKTINCTQDFEPCSNPFILAEIESFKGQNIFSLNSTKLVNLLTTGDFQTRGGEIKKILPNTLTLSLQSVYPIMALHVEGENRYVTLDSSLRVIRVIETNPHVPTIELKTPLSLQVGHPINDQSISQVVTAASKVVHQIPGISQISLLGDDFTLTLSENILSTLTINRDIEDQISALKAILGDATIREGLRKVDVRFAQPVLVKD